VLLAEESRENQTVGHSAAGVPLGEGQNPDAAAAQDLARGTKPHREGRGCHCSAECRGKEASRLGEVEV
jgi:hypothetical protein